jgi:hypothetical protein
MGTRVLSLSGCIDIGVLSTGKLRNYLVKTSIRSTGSTRFELWRFLLTFN